MLSKEQNVFEINEIQYTCSKLHCIIIKFFLSFISLLIASGKRKGYSSPDVQFPSSNVMQAGVAMGYIHKASWSMT